MHWTFARNDGGRESGFHDAGLETFKGNFDRYLAREMIQNSLDARMDQNTPVRVHFEMLELKRESIPAMDYLDDTFHRCLDYWRGQKKASEFFTKATSLSSQLVLRALKVSDYNTTGVPGADDDRTKNWYHLVRCAGSSSKGGGEGGSFGIGKNAPFAASNLRTVFYSSCDPEDNFAFQGVATLVSHKLPDGAAAQPTGFLGGAKGESIRDPNLVPDAFRRSSCGLDIVILEYAARENWAEDLLFSVLDNFWPAIEHKDLVVKVDSQEVCQSNLSELMQRFSNYPEFDAHEYYQAFKKPSKKFKRELHNLRDCELYISLSGDNLRKRIAMIRKPGMVVYQQDRLQSILPFAGVFICRNEAGNEILREMEPPRHDIWDQDHPEKGANRKIKSEYMDFIRSCLRELINFDQSKSLSIPNLNRFLPDDDDDETPEEIFDSGDEKTIKETPERSALPKVIEGRKIETKWASFRPDSTKPLGEAMDTLQEEEDVPYEEWSDYQSQRESAHGGTPEGGTEERPVRPIQGEPGGTGPKPAVPIHYRVYSQQPDKGIYTIVIKRRDQKDGRVSIIMHTVGDDQMELTLIKHAKTEDGESLCVQRDSIVGPVDLSSDSGQRLEVALFAPMRIAVEVSAYEAS